MLCIVISIHLNAVLTAVGSPCRQGQSPAGPASRPSDVVIISDNEDVRSMPRARAVSERKQACPGYLLTFPRGQWADTSYPFALHTLLSLPWYYSTHKEGFILVSHSCLGLTIAGQHCGPCHDLGNNEYLKKIIARYTNGVHDNAPLVFHGIGGLVEVVRHKASLINTLQLRHDVISTRPEKSLGKRVLSTFTSKCLLWCQHNASLA